MLRGRHDEAAYFLEAYMQEIESSLPGCASAILKCFFDSFIFLFFFFFP